MSRGPHGPRHGVPRAGLTLSMALEGPSFFFFARFVLSAATASITIDLDLHRRGLLLHEVIGPRYHGMCHFDRYNLLIYALGSFHFWWLLGSYTNPLDHCWGDWWGDLASWYSWVLVSHQGGFAEPSSAPTILSFYILYLTHLSHSPSPTIRRTFEGYTLSYGKKGLKAQGVKEVGER